MPDGIQNTLKRTAKMKRKFTGGIFAPPRVIEGELYVFHGDKLAILDPEGKQEKPRDSESLFDPDADIRPSSSGDGTNIKLEKDELQWWLPRTAPEPFDKGKVLLSLRSRDIVLLDTKTMKAEKLFQLSTEPVSRPHIELKSLQGFPLVAVGSAEGRIFVYNVTKDQIQPVTKDPILADPRPEKKASVVALATRSERQFISLSSTGYVRCFSTFELNSNKDKDVWHIDLQSDLGGVANDLPAGKENLAAFVLKNGNVVVYNLDTQQKAWELIAKPAEEYTHALVTPDGIYGFNRKQQISKFERESNVGQPHLAWGPHNLDGNSDLPLVAIPNVGVFICTDVGTITGRKAKTGDKIFEINTNNIPGKPSAFLSFRRRPALSGLPHRRHVDSFHGRPVARVFWPHPESHRRAHVLFFSGIYYQTAVWRR